MNVERGEKNVAPASTAEQPEGGIDREAAVEGEVEELRRELSAVYRISAALSSRVELDDVVQEALRVSLETVKAAAGTIYLHDPKSDRLVFKYVVGERAKELIGMAIGSDQGISGQVFHSGVPKLTEDASRDPHYLAEVGKKVDYITRNMITVPMRTSQAKTIGVLQSLNKATGNFTTQDMALLTIVAAQAAGAVENALLHQQARLAAVANVLGDISHDAKNFLTPVVTGAKTLEMELQTFFEALDTIVKECEQDHPESAARVVEAAAFLREIYPEIMVMIEDGVDSIQAMVSQIADCVKGIVAEPQFEPTDINQIALKVGETLRLTAERRGVTVDTDGLKEIPRTMADQRRIFSALYNLVNNAIPETPSGGKVSICTDATPEGEWPEGGYITIEVADTGRGMPDEVKERLFTDNAISTKPGGSGLGTRIVKNVVDTHRGTIAVESEEGKGTTFLIRLPLRSS